MPFVRFLSHSHAKFLFKTWLCLMCLFFAIRSIFYLVNHGSAPAHPNSTAAFFIGFRFDNVIICYCLFIPFVLLSIASFIRPKLFLYRASLYVVLIEVALVELVMCANIPYFKQFGSVISRNAFLWDASPGMMTGLVFSHFGYWGYLILFGIIYFISFFFIKSYFYQLKEDEKDFPQQKMSFKIIAFFMFTIYLILGARGTFSQKTTIHRGFAAISDNQFINAVGLNPCFVFFKSFTSKQEEASYKAPENIAEYFNHVKKYLNLKESQGLSIDRMVKNNSIAARPNVIIVVMESAAMYKLGYWSGKNLMPEFTSLIKESVLFDRFYSSGIHTFNGLFSTQTGFPSIFTEHALVKYNQKPFNSIGTILRSNAYNNYFFTSHDANFDNMAGFFKLNGYNNIISQYDFSSGQVVSALGVPDHVLFEKVVSEVGKSKEPFHAFVLTSSDHGPWTVPGNIPFKPSSPDEKERATQYADWSVGQFMASAKKQSWYKNTVFMFLGDHGLYTDKSYGMPLSYHHIPFVVHWPAQLRADTISEPGYQPDVMATTMGLLNIDHQDNSFGIDLFKEKHPYVFFSADSEYGTMDAKGIYYFNILSENSKHVRNGLKYEEKELYPEMKNYADSMEMNARSIIETAKYIIHQNYYNK